MSEMGMYRYCYSLDCNSTDVPPFVAVRPCQHLQSRARGRSGYSDCVSTAILTSFTSLHTYKLRSARIILFFALALSMSSPAQEHPPDHNWGYSGVLGPSHWGDLKPEFAPCKAGHHQSPIDIRNPQKPPYLRSSSTTSLLLSTLLITATPSWSTTGLAASFWSATGNTHSSSSIFTSLAKRRSTARGLT
jgi:hypothetical protein